MVASMYMYQSGFPWQRPADKSFARRGARKVLRENLIKMCKERTQQKLTPVLGMKMQQGRGVIWLFLKIPMNNHNTGEPS